MVYYSFARTDTTVFWGGEGHADENEYAASTSAPSQAMQHFRTHALRRELLTCPMNNDPGASIQLLRNAIAQTTKTTLRLWSDWDCQSFGRTSFILWPWVKQDETSMLMAHYCADPLGVVRASSPADADIAVLPFEGSCLMNQPYRNADANAVRYAQNFVAQAKSHGLATLVLDAGDSSDVFPIDFDIVLRHSVDAAARSPVTHCMPGWFDAAQNADPAHVITPSPRKALPTVGFCGQSASSGVRHVLSQSRKVLRRAAAGRLSAAYHTMTAPLIPTSPGKDGVDALRLRRSVLHHLHQSNRLHARFVVRNHYFASAHDKQRARDEFVANIVSSDYAICVRGFGNFSFRFYDALSNGRVPALIDTDCSLPFDDTLDYARILPVIPITQIHRAADIIADHYHSFSDAQWNDLLRLLRELYLSLLTPRSFFGNLSRLSAVKTVHTRRAYATTPA